MNRSLPENQIKRQDKAAGDNIKQAAGRQGKKPPKKITEKYLYNSGLAYLQRFPASIPHFKRVMLRKIDKSCKHHTDQDHEACAALLDAAVATFQRQGLLDDTAYTQGMVNTFRRRGLSERAIQYKLQQKGLPAEEIEKYLQQFDDGDAKQGEWIAALRLIRRKRLGCFTGKTGKEIDPQALRNRQLAALARGGFAFDIAQKALDASIEDAEDILRQNP